MEGPDERYLQDYNQWKPHCCVNINDTIMEQIDFGRKVRDKMMIYDIEGEDLWREVKEVKQEDKKRKKQEDEATRRKKKMRALNTRRVDTRPKPTARALKAAETDRKRALKAAATEEKKAVAASKREAKAAATAAAKAARKATNPKTQANQGPSKRPRR